MRIERRQFLEPVWRREKLSRKENLCQLAALLAIISCRSLGSNIRCFPAIYKHSTYFPSFPRQRRHYVMTVAFLTELRRNLLRQPVLRSPDSLRNGVTFPRILASSLLVSGKHNDFQNVVTHREYKRKQWE